MLIFTQLAFRIPIETSKEEELSALKVHMENLERELESSRSECEHLNQMVLIQQLRVCIH